MSRKQQKITRLRRLEDAIRDNRVYCTKHNEYITIREMYKKKCYTGNHGRNYCKYLRID